jgi:hypothetical protein
LGNLRIGETLDTSRNYINGTVDDVRIYNTARTQAEITTDMNNLSAGPSSGNNFYQCLTDATAGGDLSATTGNWVVFVDGNLTVNSNLIINSNSTLIFVVRGSITVNTSVTRADGVYIAGGTFSDYDVGAGKSRSTSPYQLVINGAVYANTFDLGSFLSNQPACDPTCTNSKTAADVINFQPRYLVAITQMIGSPAVSWQEVAP